MTRAASALEAGHHDDVTATVWPPVRIAMEALFTAIATVQRGRAFHPRGISFEAELSPTADPDALPFLREQEQTALVRLSKGIGLPSGLPDISGLAFRVPDVYGDGAHQDVLLASSGRRPGTRHLLVPTIGFDRRVFSSLLPFRHRERLLLLGARLVGPRRPGLHLDGLADAAEAGQVAFDVAVGGLTGPWRPQARLTLRRPLAPETSEQLRFHPWNTSPDLPLVGPMSVSRSPAYDASQRTASSP